MPDFKIRLQGSEGYRVFSRYPYDLTTLREDVKEAFDLKNDNFNILYLDEAGDYVVLTSLETYRPRYLISEYTYVKCILQIKSKKPTAPQVNASTSTEPTAASSTTANPISTSSVSIDTKLSSTSSAVVSNSQGDLNQMNKISKSLRRMEKLLEKTSRNTSTMAHLAYERQQQQQEQKRLETSSCLADSIKHTDDDSIHLTSSPSCGNHFTGRHWICNQSPDHDTHRVCHSSCSCLCRRVASTPPGQDKSCNTGDLNTSSGSEHNNVVCDHCESTIVGVRYKCGHCQNFDLCETCEPLAIHSQDHVFLKIRRPLVPLTTMHSTLLPVFDYAYKSTDCTTHQKPQANAEHEVSPTNNDNVAIGKSTPKQGAGPLAALMDQTNITDGHPVEASQSFLKLWRLKNIGSVPWPSGCMLKYISGNVQPTKARYLDAMKLPEVLPGDEVTVSIYLTAPRIPGQHSSSFRMMTPQGAHFGGTIWCKIKVTPSQPLEATTLSKMGLETVSTTETTRSTSTSDLTSESAHSVTSDLAIVFSAGTANYQDDSDNETYDGNKHYPALGSACDSSNNTATPATQHDCQLSSPSSPTGYVIIAKDNMDSLTFSPLQPSSPPPREKSSKTQSDITHWLKLSDKQQQLTTERFPYSQQLAQIHEMGIMGFDEEAKKLLMAHDGNMGVIWPKLLQTCYPTN